MHSYVLQYFLYSQSNPMSAKQLGPECDAELLQLKQFKIQKYFQQTASREFEF